MQLPWIVYGASDVSSTPTILRKVRLNPLVGKAGFEPAYVPATAVQLHRANHVAYAALPCHLGHFPMYCLFGGISQVYGLYCTPPVLIWRNRLTGNRTVRYPLCSTPKHGGSLRAVYRSANPCSVLRAYRRASGCRRGATPLRPERRARFSSLILRVPTAGIEPATTTRRQYAIQRAPCRHIPAQPFRPSGLMKGRMLHQVFIPFAIIHNSTENPHKPHNLLKIALNFHSHCAFLVVYKSRSLHPTVSVYVVILDDLPQLTILQAVNKPVDLFELFLQPCTPFF